MREPASWHEPAPELLEALQSIRHRGGNEACDGLVGGCGMCIWVYLAWSGQTLNGDPPTCLVCDRQHWPWQAFLRHRELATPDPRCVRSGCPSICEPISHSGCPLSHANPMFGGPVT